MSDASITKNNLVRPPQEIGAPIEMEPLEIVVSAPVDRSEPAGPNRFRGGAKWEPSPSLDAVQAGRTVLRAGHSGGATEALQRKLNEHAGASGLQPVAVDGLFGAETQRRIRELQETYGLAVDGLVGPETLRQLHRLDLKKLEESQRYQQLTPMIQESGLAMLEDLAADGSWTHLETAKQVLADERFAGLSPAVQLEVLSKLHHAAIGGDRSSFQFVANIARDREFAALSEQKQRMLLDLDPDWLRRSVEG